MNEADEAESRSARSFMTDPLGAWTSIQNVIKSESEARPVARFDVTGLTGGAGGGVG